MKIQLIIVFLVLAKFCFACDCKITNLKETRENSIRMSNLIFIGEVIPNDNNEDHYALKVIEVIKGVLPSDTIIGIPQTSCSNIPTSGKWLIYFDLNLGGKLDYTVCGASRSFDQPEMALVSEYLDYMPQPPNKFEHIFGTGKKKKQLLKTKQDNLKALAKSDLEKELNELRVRFKK